MGKKIIKLVIFFSIGIFFIIFSFYKIHFSPHIHLTSRLSSEDFEKIKITALGIFHFKNLLFIFFSILCGAIAHYFRALRNILLINPLGYRVRKTTAFYSVMICYLANLAIPRLGEVMRCTFLQRYDKVPFQKSLGTVVVERVFDLLIFVVLFVLIFFLNQELLLNVKINDSGTTPNSWLQEKWATLWALKYIVFGTLLAIVISIFILKKTSRNKGKKHSKIIDKFKNILVGLWQGLISIKDLKHPYLFIVYTVSIWGFYFLGTYFCFFAFDFLKDLGPMPAFVVLVVGSIGFMIAQGGLGAYPLIVAGIFVLYDINYAQGIAAGWIGWSAQTIMILLVGFTSLILTSFLKIENRETNNI